MTINNSQLIKVLDLSQKLLQIVQLPLFGEKHSPKTFTQHQLFKLMIVKTYLNMDYRKFVDYLETSKIPEYLGMNRIPHYTTLQKFAQRQNIQKLEKFLSKFVELHGKKVRNLGADATGFKSTYASEHYEKRIGRTIVKKDFIKANFFYDLDKLLIYAVKIRKKSRHDTRDLSALFNKVKSVEFKRFYADKAYDAEWFHEMIHDFGGESRIHLKNEDVPVHRTHGRWRKHIKRKQKNSQKGKRSLCETINSSIKRLFGSVLRAKTLTMKKVELLFKIITYNLDRLVKIAKSFLQALCLLLCFEVLEQKMVLEF